MAEEKEPKELVKPKLYDLGMVIALRVVDSGLGPWLMVVAVVLCFVWLMTRNLNSADTLLLLSRIGTLKGLAWCGWGIALIEVPIFVWVVNGIKRGALDRSNRSEAESEKARDRLKTLKQSELPIEQKPS
jgi:hypothetical protein